MTVGFHSGGVLGFLALGDLIAGSSLTPSSGGGTSLGGGDCSTWESVACGLGVGEDVGNGSFVGSF